MKRIIALLLCFSIIFTSVAPLYAQGADAVRAEREAVGSFKGSFIITYEDPYAQGGYAVLRAEREAVESFEASFDRAVSEAARAHRTNVGAYEKQLSTAWIEEEALAAGMSVSAYEEKLEEEFWTKQKQYSKILILWDFADEIARAQSYDWLGSDFLKKCERSISKRRVSKKENPFEEFLKFDMAPELSQATGLPVGQPAYINRGIHMQSCIDTYLYGDRADQRVTYENIAYGEALLEMVSKYGVSEENVERVYQYLEGIISIEGLGEITTNAYRVYDSDLQSRMFLLAGKALEVMALIGLTHKEYLSRAEKDIYDFITSHHRDKDGKFVSIIYQGLLALLGMNTAGSRGKLKDFIVEQADRTGGGAFVEGLGYFSFEGIVDASAEGRDGKYLNIYSIRWQYNDEDFNRKVGLWQGQVAYGNLLEDFGKALVLDALSNPATLKMLNGINWNNVVKPLAVGVLIGPDGYEGWYARARYKGNAETYLTSLLKTDFADFNEGTQRRLRYQAAKALSKQGYTGEYSSGQEFIAHYLKKDENKHESYERLQRGKMMAMLADILIILLYLPNIVKGLATLGLRGVKAFTTVTGLRKVTALSVRALGKVSTWTTMPYLWEFFKTTKVLSVGEVQSKVKILSKAQKAQFGKILSKEISVMRAGKGGKGALTAAELDRAYTSAWGLYSARNVGATVRTSTVVTETVRETIPGNFAIEMVDDAAVRGTQIASLGEGSQALRMSTKEARLTLRNLRERVAQRPWIKGRVQAKYVENMAAARRAAAEAKRSVDVTDVVESYRKAYLTISEEMSIARSAGYAGGGASKVTNTAKSVKQVTAYVDGGTTPISAWVPTVESAVKPVKPTSFLGKVGEAVKWNWQVRKATGFFPVLKELPLVARTRRGLATLLVSGSLLFSPAPMLSGMANATAKATTAIEMVVNTTRAADTVVDVAQVGAKANTAVQSVRNAADVVKVVSKTTNGTGLLTQLSRVGGLINPAANGAIMLHMALPVRWRAGERSGLFDGAVKDELFMTMGDVFDWQSQQKVAYAKQVDRYVAAHSQAPLVTQHTSIGTRYVGAEEQYDFWQLQQRELNYQLGKEATKMYWAQAGAPLMATLQNGLRTLTEGTYLNVIAPMLFSKNIHYLKHQAKMHSTVSSAEESALAEAMPGVDTSKFFAFKSFSLENAPVESKISVSQKVKNFANRLLGRYNKIKEISLEDQIRQVLWDDLGGAYSLGIVFRNPLIDRLETNQTANKYTKETEALLAESRRQALQEYIDTYGDDLEIFNKDKNFVRIYQQKIEDNVGKSSLPPNVRAIVLNNVALSFENSSILHVPVFNKQNQLIGTVAIDRPEKMKVRDNQYYYIISQPGSKKGEMFLWETTVSDVGNTTGKQILIRSDIPLEVVGRQVRTTGFGMKKVAEGLLMINNRIWPMFGLYLLAGMGNVTTVISTFAKESFVMSNMEMYLMGGVSSVAMGIVSLFAGVWQNRWSFTKDGGYNERRGRLITTNIGLISAVLAFVLPWLAGGMGGMLGEAEIYKKYLLISSFLLLGVSGAFLDVSMKPTLMAVSHRGEYQSRLGTLSVFKQTIGNVSNYVVPPIAMAVAMMIGTQWDWTIFFPIYTVGSIAIAGMYNLFKMHEQTLSETEVASPKEALSFKKMFQEFSGKKQYNKLIRRGVFATAFHGANMSIFGMYVNNLMKDHFDAFNLTALYADNVTSVGKMIDIMAHSWLGYSMLYFTVPIILGRIAGTRLMKKDNFLGLPIKRMNGGDLLKVSIGAVGLGILLLNMSSWPLQVAGVVTLALGLTNISPIVGGYVTDHTRHVSDAVSALLSGASLVSFAISTVFGLTLDLFATGSSGFAWAPFIIPTLLSLYLFGFGKAISSGSLETKETVEEETDKIRKYQKDADSSYKKNKTKKNKKRK